ncbi:MAG: NosD domain-containing protein, partial [bacterium]
STRNRVRSNMVTGNQTGILIDSSNGKNRFVQNLIRNNSQWGVSIQGTSSGDTIIRNNIYPSTTNPDSGLENTSGNNHRITRNYWGVTDEDTLGIRVDDPINDFRPYRFGKVDTGINGDSIAPATPGSDTVISKISERMDVRWKEVTEDEDSSTLNFLTYRVYRAHADSLPMSDWKNNATLVTNTDNDGDANNSPTDTGIIDTNVVAGDTYHYRITAVDNKSPENESFFSDTVTAVAKFWDTGAVTLSSNHSAGADVTMPNSDTHYLVGGYIDTTNETNAVLAYSDTTGWTSSSKPNPFPGKGLRNLSAAVTPNGDTMFTVGGRSSTGDTSSVKAYDFNTEQWVHYPNLPVTFERGQAVIISDTLYALGGRQDGNYGGDTVYTYQITQGTNGSWDTFAVSKMNTGRDDFEAVVANGGIYVFGGQDPSFNELSSVEFYDPATNSWTLQTSMPVTRSLFAAVKKNGNVYAISGKAGGSLDSTVDIYNISGDSWSSGISKPGIGKQDLAGGVSGNTIIVSGGGVKTVNRAKP